MVFLIRQPVCCNKPIELNWMLSPSTDAKRGSSDNEAETKYLQSRRYLEMNERLQEVRGELVQQREELWVAKEQLEISVAEVKGRAL